MQRQEYRQRGATTHDRNTTRVPVERPCRPVTRAPTHASLPTRTHTRRPPYPPYLQVVALKAGGVNIPVRDALSKVFGYAVGVDLTRRDVQVRGGSGMCSAARSRLDLAAMCWKSSAPRPQIFRRGKRSLRSGRGIWQRCAAAGATARDSTPGATPDAHHLACASHLDAHLVSRASPFSPFPLSSYCLYDVSFAVLFSVSRRGSISPVRCRQSSGRKK